MLTKEEKKRIMKFITYYRTLSTKKRGVLMKLIKNGCGFKGGTFYYKFNNKNYSKLEIDAIENIVNKYQEDESKKS